MDVTVRRARPQWARGPSTLIKEFSPDLLFLDVQMPGLLTDSGFLKKLIDKKRVPLPQIVFATAL